jgi:outer membrane protein TolC
MQNHTLTTPVMQARLLRLSLFSIHYRDMRLAVFISCLLCLPFFAGAQGPSDNDTTRVLSLEDCIHFALKNQPALKQSLIDESIAHTNNLIGLSGWMPQVMGSATFDHYFQLPIAFSGNTEFPSGTFYSATPSITASQTLFSSDVLFAARAAHLFTEYSKQNTVYTKINLVSNVTKSFYDLLLTIQQINVLKEDTARLGKNERDTYHQYKSGLVDKVDNKQAKIALNNAVAQLKNAMETVGAKYSTLKQYIGFPDKQEFTVEFDTTEMLQEVYFDTTEMLDYSKRIEYQQLLVSKRLQRETTSYYQLSFLPSLSAFYNYTPEYQSDTYSTLFNQSYPYSLFGLSLNLPIFQGFKRLENIHKAKLEEQRTDWDIVNTKLGINAEYVHALADYKSNYMNLHEQGENVQLAKEVYNIVQLQYKEGVKTYLNVIVAETDLRTSQINYLGALFQLLSSKIDLQKALGDININP